MQAAVFTQLLLMAALWGGSYLFLRISVPDFGPIPLIAIRVAIAALLFVPFLVGGRGWQREFRQHAGSLFVLGLINAAIPFPLFAYATLHLSAGFAAVINATAPLFATLLAWAWLRDRPGAGAVAGLLIGVAGVVVLVGGVPPGAGNAPAAIAAALGASLSYGLSANFVKRRLSGVSAWVTTTGSFGFAALTLAPLAWLTWPEAAPSARAWLAVLALAVACTSLPNIFYFRLILSAGPARAMSVAYLIPVFGILWGVLALGERVTPNMVLGGLVILLGTALVTGAAGAWRRLLRRGSALPARPPAE